MTAWMERAECRRHDPDLWFPNLLGPESTKSPEVGPHVDAPVAICKACPVRSECLSDALETGEAWGIRGGLTPHQRKQLKRKAA